MKLKDLLKTISGVWDTFDNVAFLLFALFVLAGLGYAAIRYFAE